MSALCSSRCRCSECMLFGCWKLQCLGMSVMNWEVRRWKKVMLEAGSAEHFVGVLILLVVFSWCAKWKVDCGGVLHMCKYIKHLKWNPKFHSVETNKNNLSVFQDTLSIASFNPELQKFWRYGKLPSMKMMCTVAKHLRSFVVLVLFFFFPFRLKER